MDRERAHDRRRRYREQRFADEVGDAIDAQEAEQHRREAEQQPEHAGEERGLRERQRAAPGDVEQRRIRSGPAPAGEPQLEQRHREQPRERQGQHEGRDRVPVAVVSARPSVGPGRVEPDVRRGEPGGGHRDEQRTPCEREMQHALASERPEQMQRQRQHREQQHDRQHHPRVPGGPAVLRHAVQEPPQQQALDEGEGDRRERQGGFGVSGGVRHGPHCRPRPVGRSHSTRGSGRVQSQVASPARPAATANTGTVGP